MSDTYGTWIYPHMMKADTVYRHTFENGVTLDISVPVGYNAREAIALLVSKDEEQPQVPAGEPVQEEADQDIPLDFELTEACFRGLPPLVDAGKKEWEEVYVGSLGTSGRLAPIGEILDEIDLPHPGRHLTLGVVDDEPVESWAAEAEAKRWRGDMLHILSHCNICGAVSVHSEPHCAACREEGGCFTAFWTASAGTTEEALEAWDAAAYRRTWGGRQPQPFA